MGKTFCLSLHETVKKKIDILSTLLTEKGGPGLQLAGGCVVLLLVWRQPEEEDWRKMGLG